MLFAIPNCVVKLTLKVAILGLLSTAILLPVSQASAREMKHLTPSMGLSDIPEGISAAMAMADQLGTVKPAPAAAQPTGTAKDIRLIDVVKVNHESVNFRLAF